MSTRRKVLLFLFLTLLTVGFAARCVWVLASTARDLTKAEDLLDEAATALVEGELALATQRLDEAQELVLSANGALRGSLELDILSVVPVARQNLQAIEDSVSLAATLVHGGGRILSQSEQLQSDEGKLEVSLSDGSIPLASVSKARREIELLRSQMRPALREDEPSFLAGPVKTMREEVLDEARSREAQLSVLGRGLTLLEEFAGGNGPRRYLIAVANTAEMRGSGGMILNYGVLEGKDGTIDLTEFGRVDEIPVVQPVSESLVPADYLARWAGFDPLARLRQANLSGDFTVVAPVLQALYTQATQLPVHGVIQVDPQGLAAILEGVGPVSIPEVGEVSAGNVVPLTLHDAYILFPNVEERSDVLGDVAEAAFTRLVDGDFPSLRPLAESIAEAVDGRHIIVHADAARTESVIEAFGADGSYPDVETVDSFALTAQNLAGHKLDWYLDTDLSLIGERPSASVGEINAKVTLTNTTPAGADDPQYIYGPGVGGLPAGIMRSVVTLYLPLGTSLADSGGDALVEPISSGTEAGRPYVSFLIDVPAASARTVDLTLRVPPRATDEPELRFMASPRVRPTTVSVDVGTDQGRMAGQFSLDRTWSLEPGRPAQEVVPPAYK